METMENKDNYFLNMVLNENAWPKTEANIAGNNNDNDEHLAHQKRQSEFMSTGSLDVLSEVAVNRLKSYGLTVDVEHPVSPGRSTDSGSPVDFVVSPVVSVKSAQLFHSCSVVSPLASDDSAAHSGVSDALITCFVCGKQKPLSKLIDHLRTHNNCASCLKTSARIDEYKMRCDCRKTSTPMPSPSASCLGDKLNHTPASSGMSSPLATNFVYKLDHVPASPGMSECSTVSFHVDRENIASIPQNDDQDFVNGNNGTKEALNPFQLQVQPVEKLETKNSTVSMEEIVWSGNPSETQASSNIQTESEPFPCSFCTNSFPTKDFLDAPLRNFHDAKPFQCTLCPEKFAYCIDLYEHFKGHEKDIKSSAKTNPTVDTEKEPFSCSGCNSSFSTQEFLDAHGEGCHNTKKFSCTCCPEIFVSTAVLEEHLITHKKGLESDTKVSSGIDTENEPFPCPSCTKTFPTQDFLANHLGNYHHVKTFACHLCPRKFSLNGYLQNHIKAHKLFSCMHCPESFANKSQLMRHLRIHGNCKVLVRPLNIAKVRRVPGSRSCYVSPADVSPIDGNEQETSRYSSKNSERKRAVEPTIGDSDDRIASKVVVRSLRIANLQKVVDGSSYYVSPADVAFADKNENVIPKNSARKRSKKDTIAEGDDMSSKNSMKMRSNDALIGDDSHQVIDGIHKKVSTNSPERSLGAGVVQVKEKMVSKTSLRNGSIDATVINVTDKMASKISPRKRSLNDAIRKMVSINSPVKSPESIDQSLSSKKMVETRKNENDIFPLDVQGKVSKTHVMDVDGNMVDVQVTMYPDKSAVNSSESLNLPIFSNINTLNNGDQTESLGGSGSIHKESSESEVIVHPYQCNECSMSFPRKQLLSMHLRNYHDIKAIKCPQCEETFGYEVELKKHLRVHKTDPPVPAQTFPCPYCPKSFGKKAQLGMHLNVHADLNPFECHACAKSFRTNSALKTHLEQEHAGEKIYPCTQCTKSFKTYGSLSAHKRTHKAERRFPCNECDKSFTCSSNLNAHLRTHTGWKPYECQLCSLGFSQMCHWQRHMRSHTAEKRYRCFGCDRGFDRVNNMKSMEDSTGEKLYFCTHCVKEFPENHVLKQK